MTETEMFLIISVGFLTLFDVYLLYEFYRLKKSHNHQNDIIGKLLEEFQDAFNEITKLYKRAKELNEKIEKETSNDRN